MPLSELPDDGPEFPAGVQKVSLKRVDVDHSTKRVDVTLLEDEERKYEVPPLKESTAEKPTATCSASGLIKDSTVLEVTPIDENEGWICENYQEDYEVGKYASWSAAWIYLPVLGGS